VKRSADVLVLALGLVTFIVAWILVSAILQMAPPPASQLRAIQRSVIVCRGDDAHCRVLEPQ
jgi:hypothetical protein